MTRPSRRLTLSVSSVDCTSSTRSSAADAEKLMPCLQELFPVPGHHRLYSAQFVGAKPKIARQLDWVKPELSRQVVATRTCRGGAWTGRPSGLACTRSPFHLPSVRGSWVGGNRSRGG